MNATDIPSDVWRVCFQFLTFQEISMARLVCKTWKKAIEDSKMSLFMPSHPLEKIFFLGRESDNWYARYCKLSTAKVEVYVDVSASIHENNMSLPMVAQEKLKQLAHTYLPFLKIHLIPFTHWEKNAIVIHESEGLKQTISKLMRETVSSDFSHLFSSCLSSGTLNSHRLHICYVCSPLEVIREGQNEFHKWVSSMHQKIQSSKNFHITFMHCPSNATSQNSWTLTFKEHVERYHEKEKMFWMEFEEFGFERAKKKLKAN